jgi:alkylhydroperoxidase/carboxymuconolactone decarboxylase family protein YurZ
MALMPKIEYDQASTAVRAVYDDMRATRNNDYINDVWKVLANDPALLKRSWEQTKTVMSAGALDALTKELIYLAVSITNNCEYYINTHTAR